MSEQNLKKYIAELIQEVEKELEESTTTANVDGYNTPHAFSRKKDKERRKKNATQLGYELVDDDVDNITEAIKKISSAQYKKLEAEIKKLNPKIKISLDSSAPGGFEIIIPDDNKYVYHTDKVNALVHKITGDHRNGRIMFEGKKFKQVKKDKYGNHLEPQFKKGDLVTYLRYPAIITSVNKESGGVYSYNVDYNKGNGRTSARNIFNKSGNELKEGVDINEAQVVNKKTGKDITKHVLDLLSGKINQKQFEKLTGLKKESVNENRWLELKNDESMHPHKKMAMGLKELKYQLAETEKFFNWYNKIKTMNELDSQKYWKRTQNHIYKIKERLINIARTLQEIEK